MKEIYEKIWKLALPYQDKRNDEGHARIVTSYAQELLKSVKANPDIVIPAAMLHDTGWSQMPEKDRFLIFDPNKTPEQESKVRLKHEEEGSRIAQMLLSALNYVQLLTEQIKGIIKGHDTRKEAISLEDEIVRDADKLWRYSKIGFWADIKRMKEITPQQLCDKLEKNIEKEGFFFTEPAKNIAREELKQRREEF